MYLYQVLVIMWKFVERLPLNWRPNTYCSSLGIKLESLFGSHISIGVFSSVVHKSECKAPAPAIGAIRSTTTQCWCHSFCTLYPPEKGGTGKYIQSSAVFHLVLYGPVWKYCGASTTKKCCGTIIVPFNWCQINTCVLIVFAFTDRCVNNNEALVKTWPQK